MTLLEARKASSEEDEPDLDDLDFPEESGEDQDYRLESEEPLIARTLGPSEGRRK